MSRILLAESDQRIRRFLAGILSDCGHSVEVCADADAATTSLASGAIDVVVSDFVLERGDKGGLGRRCATFGIPAYTLSGSKFRPGLLAAEQPAALLEKPFRFRDLETVLEVVMRTQPE
jgi:DNA-binding NtrC family response regulator